MGDGEASGPGPGFGPDGDPIRRSRRRPTRLEARAAAHALIEQVQSAPEPACVEWWLSIAEEHDWFESAVLLHGCRLLDAALRGEPPERLHPLAGAVLGAAEATGEEILVAYALAARAVHLGRGPREDDLSGEDLDAGLARAVAMLDDAAVACSAAGEHLRALELPMAFVACGQAYHRRGLWELEEEMYRRAAGALELVVPEPVRHLGRLTARVLVVNRFEARLALVCTMLEVGLRAPARELAASAPVVDPADRADLPPIWRREVDAVARLLAAVAGEPPGGPDSGLHADLTRSTWSGYRACLLLADAVRALDAGQADGCARLAERALSLVDADYLPSVRDLALALAAASAVDGDPTVRWARHLAQQRWDARLQVLGSARARLAAARIVRQGEQLSRQAYVDGLTGLANRHALARQLTRLRQAAGHERVGVVLVDVDHFKAINDTHGHTVGDEVLREIGHLLAESVRTHDLAVRLGGDEFMVLLELPEPATAAARARDLVHAVAAHPWSRVATGLAVTVSAGQAVGASRQVDAVVQDADDRLYQAKAAGRGRAVTGEDG